MSRDLELKALVKEKYSEIARRGSTAAASGCCGETVDPCCDDVVAVTAVMADDYTVLEGYTPDADLGLGCGLPTQFAQIRPGDTVIDLGSGAGNDCFIARHESGPDGRIIGVDFSQEMIARARANAAKLGFANVEFRHGDIEAMPVEDATAHVVVSNCVLNLAPNKQAVFSEILRVLKPGGHFSISDIVTRGALPAGMQASAELYAGCVAGAIPLDEYLGLIRAAGFVNLTVQKEKRITLPDELLKEHLSGAELAAYRREEMGILSVTVYAEKPV